MEEKLYITARSCFYSRCYSLFAISKLWESSRTRRYKCWLVNSQGFIKIDDRRGCFISHVENNDSRGYFKIARNWGEEDEYDKLPYMQWKNWTYI